MIQAIGLTSAPRRSAPPAVDDLTFEARAGHVTALLGGPGAGKTTALRVLLQLEPGRGVALFRGRPLDRIPHPTREVGVVLGDVPGHPARTARSHVRMLGAAAGVPAQRADAVLDLVGLSGIADQRLGSLSRGMDRRLGLAVALIGDPHTLVLDEPGHGLSPREAAWLHGMLRRCAAQGSAVLITARDPKEAARIADRVVTIHRGRLVADQKAADFARTRLRPRVAVRSPHAARLAALLTDEMRPDGPSEVVHESGTRICVYGSSCAAVGELAFRHGILVHQLADEVGDSGPVPPPLDRADGRSAPSSAPTAPAAEAPPVQRDHPRAPGESAAAPAPQEPAAAPGPQESPTSPNPPDGPESPDAPADPATESTRSAGATSSTAAPAASAALTSGTTPESPFTPKPSPTPESSTPPSPSPSPSPDAEIAQVAQPGSAWLLRYELRRAGGVWTSWIAAATTLAAGLLLALLTARISDAPPARLLAGWPGELPLPPAAFGAGLLGALAFGQEFRYPALTHVNSPVPRRLGLLVAKLVVCTAAAAVLAIVSAAVNAAALRLVFGGEAVRLPPDWPVAAAGWAGLVIGCTWAGLLAAGLFRSTATGIAAVLAVPMLVVPAVRAIPVGPAAYPLAGLSDRLRSTSLLQWPGGVDRWVTGALRLGAQPVGQALALSLCALVGAYLVAVLRGKAAWWPLLRRVARELPTTQRR
ncbi:ABC transporter ATP-binding protein [Streptomyces sp. 7N604]|uniref:ABC transporter ATP-binding protein n=1 Tax=Streptomyces sp. 7N604 TaxID=3457415 RepID=UPI003FD08EFF